MLNKMREKVNPGDEILVHSHVKSWAPKPRWGVKKYIVKRNQDGHLVLHLLCHGPVSYSFNKISKQTEMSYAHLRSITQSSCLFCQIDEEIGGSPLARALKIRIRKSGKFELSPEDLFLMNLVPKKTEECFQ